MAAKKTSDKETSHKVTREQDKPEGAISEENLVQEPPPEEKPDDKKVTKSDLKKIALEVREGKWGVGQERRKKLDDAGYNAKDVEDEVTRQLNE
jgi:hypothetical protein